MREGANTVWHEVYEDMPPFCTECEKGRVRFSTWAQEPRQQEKAAARRAYLQERAVKNADFAPRFEGRTLADFHDRTILHDTLAKYVDDFKTHKHDGTGFFLYGAVGTGKTHAAVALCNALIEKYFLPVHFCKTGEAMARVRRAIFDQNNDRPLREIMETPFLVLDDLGIDNRTEFFVETLYRIIDHRYEHKLPTVITSNMSLDDVKDRYMPQISSRLLQMCCVIKFSGEDRRTSLRPQVL